MMYVPAAAVRQAVFHLPGERRAHQRKADERDQQDGRRTPQEFILLYPRSSIVNEQFCFVVPGAGIEPALSLRKNGF